jgi:hypothetical protein
VTLIYRFIASEATCAPQKFLGFTNVVFTHAWEKPSDRDALHIVSKHRPVLHMELMLEVVSRIARDFSENKKAALTHVLRAAVILNDIKSDFYFTSLVASRAHGCVSDVDTSREAARVRF